MNIPGIYIAAVISAILVVGAWGNVLLKKAEHTERRFLILLFLSQLPMSALVYYVIRFPVAQWYTAFFPKGTDIWLLLKSFEAPLTEEPGKLLPLILPSVLLRLKNYPDRKPALLAGMALGLGFGVGEILFLAYVLPQWRQDVLAYPWYYFGGSIVERFLVSFLHAVMTGIAASGIAKGFRQGATGIAYAMGLHYILNIPAIIPGFSPLRPFFKDPLALAVYQQVKWLYFLALFVFCFFIAWKWIEGRFPTAEMFLGKCICHHCGKEFEPSFFGFSLGVASGLRCPHCKKWGIYPWKPFQKFFNKKV